MDKDDDDDGFTTMTIADADKFWVVLNIASRRLRCERDEMVACDSDTSSFMLGAVLMQVFKDRDNDDDNVDDFHGRVQR